MAVQESKAIAPRPSSSSYSTQDFFQALFCSDHLDGYITFFRLDSRLVQYVPLEDLQEVALHYLDNADREPVSDLYFSLGIQKNNRQVNKRGSRGGAVDVVAIPAFWFDLDCTADYTRRKLPTRQEALDFLAFLPFQPSIVVDSGSGFHIYWLFREPWFFRNHKEWNMAAQLSSDLQHTIQEWGNRRGWHFDITADLSRVLRVPGTINAKRDPKKEVRIVRLDPSLRYNPTDFEPYLMQSKDPAKNQVKAVSFSKQHWGILRVDPILEGCSWFRHCVDDAPTLPEPEWFAMLTILAKLQGGNELAHIYGQPYPGYSANETDWKFTHASKFNGTYSCSKINLISGGKHCASCPHRSKIRNPLGLSQQVSFLAELAELKDLLHRDGEVIEQRQCETY